MPVACSSIYFLFCISFQEGKQPSNKTKVSNLAFLRSKMQLELFSSRTILLPSKHLHTHTVSKRQSHETAVNVLVENNQ